MARMARQNIWHVGPVGTFLADSLSHNTPPENSENSENNENNEKTQYF